MWFMFCYALLCVISSFAIVLMSKRETVCLTLIVFLMHCDCLCDVAFSRDAVG